MAKHERRAPPPPSDPEHGLWQGEAVARVATSPDGLTVLVGKSARDNDILTFKLAAAGDFWYHTSGQSGSHVVVLNPDRLERLPRETRRFAASLAAGYSASRSGGRIVVHEARVRDVSKPRGFAPGKVTLRRFTSIRATPARLDEGEPPSRD